jgi:uncharacterized protein (TIGR03083 family)
MGPKSSLRSLIEGEQADFVALAQQLTAEQWSAPSWCADWSVHEVILHAALHTHRTLREVIRGDDQQEVQRRRESHDALIALLGAPVNTRLSWDSTLQLDELLIHQQDVRRPLGIARVIPSDRLMVVLPSVLTNWVGRLAGVDARKRSRGLRLVATDIGWSAGSGPVVEGPAEALLMTLSGRTLAAAELVGEGVATLTERLAPRVSRAVSSLRP